MICPTASRPRRHAGGGPLERRVRPHLFPRLRPDFLWHRGQAGPHSCREPLLATRRCRDYELEWAIHGHAQGTSTSKSTTDATPTAMTSQARLLSSLKARERGAQDNATTEITAGTAYRTPIAAAIVDSPRSGVSGRLSHDHMLVQTMPRQITSHATEIHQIARMSIGVRPNVRANRRAEAGRLGPVGENVPRTADRAKVACRSASG